MADIWARVDVAIDTDPLQLRGIVAEVLARAETAEAAVERLRARHQPKTGTQITPCPKHQPYRPGVKDCPDCRTERVQVCSNITCCTWPCKDRIALDTPGGPESPAHATQDGDAADA